MFEDLNLHDDKFEFIFIISVLLISVGLMCFVIGGVELIVALGIITGVMIATTLIGAAIVLSVAFAITVFIAYCYKYYQKTIKRGV